MIVGGTFNIFIMFPNVSMMYPIAVISIMGLYSHQHGICFEVFIADSGEEFRQLVSNCVFIYVNSIIVHLYYRQVLFI